MIQVRALLVVAVFTAAGCQHGPDPALVARANLLRLCSAILAGDTRTVDALSRRSRADEASPSDRDAERKEVAAWLRTAAAGVVRSTAEVRIDGALATSAELTRDPEGWRVDPDTVGSSTPTIVGAIEHLIMALERLESDEALHLLSASLRDAVLAATRERARALRAALPTLDRGPWTSMTRSISYGHGLRLTLRFENGQWKIDDFN